MQAGGSIIVPSPIMATYVRPQCEFSSIVIPDAFDPPLPPSRTHIVGECKMYKEEWDVFRDEENKRM